MAEHLPQQSERVPWTKYGYYLTPRPSFTFDPLFHAGCYYVQEASSMFLEQALKQTVELHHPLKVLDLCGAPGGKSTHIQSVLAPESLLVTNEVIKSRVSVLEQNVIKWGTENVIITNNDPQHFARLEGFFDVMVVDAPCSGSGLFRRDPEAINEWSISNVVLCSQRQQRILANALPALKQEGILVYSTCSYSKEEDEDICDWLVQELGMENMRLEIEDQWGIVESTSVKTNAYGYRFFPDKVKGEGFFLACFRKAHETKEVGFKLKKIDTVNKREKEFIDKWLVDTTAELIKFRDNIVAIPAHVSRDFTIINDTLNVIYAGVKIGQLMREKLVPDHALALSNLISDTITNNNLAYEDAIKYLQRGEFQVPFHKTGWQTVGYQNYRLGWINALPNRINNYYPKEMRILKQHNDSAFKK